MTVNTFYTELPGDVYVPVLSDFYDGLGYRSLTDDFVGVTTTAGTSGYDRRSQYFYILLGMTLGGSVRGDSRFSTTFLCVAKKNPIYQMQAIT